MQKVVLATGNPGKVKELGQLLKDHQLDVVAQSAFDVPDVPETGTTFVENAIIKARHAAKLTGLPAIADDSGLEVRTLGGAPGIYSARYSGENATDQSNIEALMQALGDNPNRAARFCCVLVYLRHHEDPTPIICQGFWDGSIALSQTGDGGFGYDPVFLPNDVAGKTAAMLSKEEKNAISHRAKALRQLVATLEQEQ